MSKFAPTAEQQAVIDLFKTGADIVVEAGAGTGKTSTLVLLAEEADTRDLVGVYIAYNKAIAKEAEGRFPRNVHAKTGHAFAFGALGKHYAKRMNTSTYVKSADLARFLGVDHDIVVGERSLNKFAQVRLAQDMVAKFCKSADTEITTKHLPYLDWLTDKGLRTQLARHILPFAEKAWRDLKLTSGTVRFTHDHYLKLWSLHSTYDNVVAGVFETPILDADFVLFDEAQDANPVLDFIVQSQPCQKVMVGDRAQAIYGWNGAIDAMSKFAGQRLQITQSFRYGQGIADCGNAFLTLLGSDLRLTGLGPESTVGTVESVSAVLCRTNAGALQEALDLQAAGRKVHIVGGASDLRKFAEGARDLMTKRWTSHAVLSIFKSWGEVQDFAKNDPDGTDLQSMVNLIDKYGHATILAVLDGTVTEDEADVVISTAHKAKGREWASVRIGEDFADRVKKNKDTGESEPQPLTPEDIMLRYVAVTRAKVALDLGPLTKYTQSQPVAA